MELQGMTGVVTGASSGIGAAIARALAAEGVSLVLSARDREALESVRDSLAKPARDRAIVEPADVAIQADVERLVARAVDEFGRIDLMVNNAGFGLFKPIEEIGVEEFDRVMAVNVRGVFLGLRTVLPVMYAQGGGTVVTISSLAGKHGFRGGGAYCTSKFAVMGLMECAFHEARRKDVRTITICPGSVDTQFFERAGTESTNPDRILRPEDVAATVLAAVKLPERALVREVDIRPANPQAPTV